MAWALSQQVGAEDSSQARERAWKHWLDVLREAYQRLPPNYDRTALEARVQLVRDRLQALRDGEEAMKALEREQLLEQQP